MGYKKYDKIIERPTRENSRPGTTGVSIHRAETLALRAELAWSLIEKFGSVAGKRYEQSPDGRGVELQTPIELVDRCFAIADLFVERCEERGEISDITKYVDEYIEHRDDWSKLR